MRTILNTTAIALFLMMANASMTQAATAGAPLASTSQITVKHGPTMPPEPWETEEPTNN